MDKGGDTMSEKPCNPVDQKTIGWLMEGDPALRWQVLRDLVHAPGHMIQEERHRVAVEGVGAHLLALQDPIRQWSDGSDRSYYQSPAGSALFVLHMLADLGLDPESSQAQKAIAMIRDSVRHYSGNMLFFDGETEACINGRILLVSAYFDLVSHPLKNRLLGEQLADGGWNCEAPPSRRSSVHSTICVLEGLAAYECIYGPDASIQAARENGENYLLTRHLMRRRSDGQFITNELTNFLFPAFWHYDILRALEYFRSSGRRPVDPMREAIEIVQAKQNENGRWILEREFPSDGLPTNLGETVGEESRWITLRALRVLQWASCLTTSHRD